MKLKKQNANKCNVLALAISCMFLAADVGATGNGDHASNKNNPNLSANIYQGSALNTHVISNKLDTLKNSGPAEGLIKTGFAIIFGDFQEYWAGEGLAAIFSQDETGKKLNKILNDLDKISQQLNQIQQEVEQSLFNENEIINKVDAGIAQQVQEFLTAYVLNETVDWQSFKDDTNSKDLATLLNNIDELNELHDFYDHNVSTMVENAKILSGDNIDLSHKNTVKASNELNDVDFNFVKDFLNGEKNLLADQINQNTDNNFDPILNDYDQSVLSFIALFAKRLEQIHIMEQGLLYFRYHKSTLPSSPDFMNITFAENGLISSADYETNKKLLDNIFLKREQTLKNLLNSYTISDNGHGFEPFAHFLNENGNFKIYNKNVLDESGLELYVWKGAIESGEVPVYGGIDNRGYLYSNFESTSIHLNYKVDCSDGGTVSIEDNTKRLMCDNVTIGYSYFDGSYYDAQSPIYIFNTRDLLVRSILLKDQ